jgi:xylulokinase
MGIIPVDKSGNVLYPNITWVDGRAEEQAKKAMNKFGGKRIFKAIVGIEITGKDVIPKLLWLKEKKTEIFNNTYKFLDVNGYLKYKCTNRMVAEWSGACSYAFDVKKKDWEHLFFKLQELAQINCPNL